MLVVRVELWPKGEASLARPIAEMRISNDATGDYERANYDVELLHSGKYWGKPGAWKKGRVLGHLRKLSPYHLVLAALVKTIGVGTSLEPRGPVTASSVSCEACGSEIVFARNSNGRSVPLDAQELDLRKELSSHTIFPRALVDGVAIRVKTLEKPESGSFKGRLVHFDTCHERRRAKEAQDARPSS